MSIDEIIKRLKSVSNKREIHEYDTIERLIVPVIEFAGWDIESIDPLILKRGNQDRRSNQRRFDIELYRAGNEAPKFIFECKKLSDDIILIGKGDSRDTQDSTNFVRQIKNDCFSGKFNFVHNWTIPILTNGEKWVIFKNELTNPIRANESITNDNYEDFVEAESSLIDPEFEKKIVRFLKDCDAEQPHAQERS